jgi:hypothetical protein
MFEWKLKRKIKRHMETLKFLNGNEIDLIQLRMKWRIRIWKKEKKIN